MFSEELVPNKYINFFSTKHNINITLSRESDGNLSTYFKARKYNDFCRPFEYVRKSYQYKSTKQILINILSFV